MLWKYAANLQPKCDFETEAEIPFRNGFSSVNLLSIFRKPIPKNISEELLLLIWIQSNYWQHFAPSLWIFNFNSKEITSHSDLS